jgi:hypothetical protein
MRTWTATDHSGNSSSCSQTITVVDTTAPTISCPGDETIMTTSASSMIVNYPAATATDNCSPPTIAYSKASGSLFNVGATTVIATAKDAIGNTAPCTFKVNVIYSWSGFLSPLSKASFKSGSTVAIKFMLTGASAGIKNLVANGYVALLTNGMPGPYTQIGTFKYDPTTANYVLNWSTKPLTPGTFRIKADLGDGVLRTLDVVLK